MQQTKKNRKFLYSLRYRHTCGSPKSLEESFILLGDQLYKIENTHFSPLDFDVKQFDALAPNSHIVSKEYKDLYNGTVFLTKSKSGVVLISL